MNPWLSRKTVLQRRTQAWCIKVARNPPKTFPALHARSASSVLARSAGAVEPGGMAEILEEASLRGPFDWR